ncbi:hypothetical protein AB0H42_12835 [Nocardia sp. NPDC050799]|uniref:hypothetical protein n=1 Tax=Nocardia sp. NPDC050799 TaxID=3154842 RepID=UPI0033D92878
MSVEQEREPFNDPVELLDELDTLIAEQEALRLRSLAARYRELEQFGDRFDKPGDPFPEEYGRINAEFAGKYLDSAVKDVEGLLKYALRPARQLAEKVRVYPQRGHADRSEFARGRSL